MSSLSKHGSYFVMSNPLAKMVSKVTKSVSINLPVGIRYADVGKNKLVSLYDVLSETGNRTRSYRSKLPQISTKTEQRVPTGVVGKDKQCIYAKSIPMIPYELVGVCVQEALTRSRANKHQKESVLAKFGMSVPTTEVIEETCLTFLEDVLPLPLYRQMNVGDWRVDAVIPSAVHKKSLIIEIDEKGHSDRDRNTELTREQDLIQLGFELIRITPEDHESPEKQLLKEVLRKILVTPK